MGICDRCQHTVGSNYCNECQYYSNFMLPPDVNCQGCVFVNYSNNVYPCSDCGVDLHNFKKKKIKAIDGPISLYEDGKYHDKHYNSDIQPIEFMQANLANKEFIGFLKGNIIKYLARMGYKDAPIKEADKVVRYSQWLAKALKNEKINPRED